MVATLTVMVIKKKWKRGSEDYAQLLLYSNMVARARPACKVVHERCILTMYQ